MLYTDFFSWIFKRSDNSSSLFLSPGIMILYATSIAFFVWFASLPWLNYFVALIPIAIYLFLSKKYKTNLMFALSMGIFITVGIFYPFSISIKITQLLDGRYQQTMLRTANSLLEKEGGYIGGIPFLYQKEQPVPGMKNLIGPALEYLYQPSSTLEPLLLPSLYLAPTNINDVIANFEKQPVKLILNNYRMLTLPPKLTQFIHDNYQHYVGSIYLYAPLIKTSQLSFNLKFAGKYRIVTNKKSTIRIDGKIIKPGKLITLKQGDHTSDASKSYRLVLTPENIPVTNYQQDEWLRMVKAIIA